VNLTRVSAIVLRHYFLARHQLERFFDVFFFPTMSLVLWGFLSRYASGLQASRFAAFLLGGLILWVIFERIGTDIGVSFMFDVWEHNVVNILVSPITLAEYITGLVVIAVAKILISLTAMSLLAAFFYNFRVTTLGFQFAIFWVNLVAFAIAFGVFNVAMVFRFGHSIGPLTWILPFILQPFAAVFYPVAVLPLGFRVIAFLLPISHVFEGMRSALSGGGVDATQLLLAAGLNAVYLAVAIGAFAHILTVVRRSGALVKLT
jgi:ABC-2 type transport system permease protein